MPLYSLVTPHVHTQDGNISFEADNDTVAWYVCLQLGRGIYMPLRGDGCEMYPSVGYNLYGTLEEADTWIENTFGNLERWKDHNQSEIINAFDSFMYSAPNNREDSASILARISDTPSLGNQRAACVINMASGYASSMSLQREKDELIAQANRPDSNSLEFTRNFEQPVYPADEPIQALKFSQPVKMHPPPWYD